MPETRQDLVSLDGKRDWMATAKFWAKVIAVAVTSLISAITAVKVAISDAHDKVQAATVHADKRIQETKNEAEAGFQFSKKWADSVEARFAELYAGRKVPPAARKGVARRTPPASPPPKAALPRDLTQAEKLIPRAAAPPPPPAPFGDAGAPR